MHVDLGDPFARAAATTQHHKLSGLMTEVCFLTFL